jgi:hypothetical protein
MLLSALAVLVFSTAAMAQSPLAEAARREAERRKAAEAAKTPAVNTYTNDDLAKLPPRPAPPKPAATEVTTVGAAGGTTPPAAGTPGAPAAPGPEAPKDEKYWRERITTARNTLSRAEMFAESLQTRVNSLTTDIINRDDPAQRDKLTQDRQRALEELAKVQAEIKEFQKAVADIEDEARRLGVPPGWLR